MAKKRGRSKAARQGKPKRRMSIANMFFIALGILMVVSVVLGPILPELIEIAPPQPTLQLLPTVDFSAPTFTPEVEPSPTIGPPPAPSPQS